MNKYTKNFIINLRKSLRKILTKLLTILMNSDHIIQTFFSIKDFDICQQLCINAYMQSLIQQYKQHLIESTFMLQQSHSMALQLCPKCANYLLLINDQRYCSNCRESAVLMYQDVRNVPQNYQSNSKEIKMSGIVKIESHVQNIFRKLHLIQTQSTVNEVVERIMELHRKRGLNSKGYLEEAAVIIFVQFIKTHKLTLRQFCTKAGVKLTKFNRIFLKFQRIKKEDKEKDNLDWLKMEVDGNIKIEQQQQEQQSLSMKDSEIRNRICNKQQERFPDNHLDGEIMQLKNEQQDEYSSQQIIKNISEHELDISQPERDISQPEQDIRSANLSEINYNNKINLKQMLKQQEQEYLSERKEEDQFCIASSKYKQDTRSENQSDGSQLSQQSAVLANKVKEKTIDSILRKLYSYIFPSLYMQQQKQFIWDDLCKKTFVFSELHEQNYPMTLKHIPNYQKCFYWLFAVIKSYGYKISIKHYQSIVKEQMGFTLNSKKLGATKKQIENFIRKQQMKSSKNSNSE